MSAKFSKLLFNVSIASFVSISSLAITTSAFAANGNDKNNSTTTTSSTGNGNGKGNSSTTTGSTGSTSTTGSTGSTTATAPTSKGSTSFSATGINTYNGTNSALSASVVFDYLSNGTLAVTLSNTALNGIKDPSDVLTSVFWDYAGSPLNLSFLSATAPTTFNASGTIGTNVDLKAINEWKYESTTSATGLGGDMTSGGTAVSQKYGLGTAGLGIFQGGGGQQFNYGVISGYSSNANNPVKTGTFVKDSATFLFSGLTSSFDITKIGNVRFQYGTNLAEAYIVPKPKEPKRKVPEPGVNAALAFIAVGGLIKLNKKTTKILKQLS